MTLHAQIDRVIRRCRAFYGAREPGHFLISVQVPAEAPAIPPLYGFDLDRQLGEWLDCKLAAARSAWRAKEGLDDDSIPSICPHFGIAEHSAWLGMEVRLQEATCLPLPLLAGPQDLDRLQLSEETPWFRYVRDGYAHLRSRQDGTFVLSVRGSVMPMELANALRGDEFFADLLTDPAFAHRLLRFSTQALDWYYGRLRRWADTFDDGQVFMFHGSWLGPDCLGHVSNDAALLCSPALYEEYGYPYEQPLAARHGSMLYHVHNQKLHFVPRVAQLPNLALLEVSNDPKVPEPIEDLPHVLGATGSANLLLHATGDQARAHIQELKVRNVFLDVTCRDRADARDVIALVRRESKELGG